VIFSSLARRFGIFSAAATVALVLAYAVTLTFGFLSLESPQQPIGEPMFSLLEILILLMMPAMVSLMVAAHAWAPKDAKPLTLVAVIFMSLLAGLTSCNHFVILCVSRQPTFAAQPWRELVFGFKWPSLVYAVDILGWDVFFPLAMFFAAPVFGGSRLARWIRLSMLAAGALALAGLAGVALGDMRVRNIGILGYVGVFLVATALLGRLFHRTTPTEL
jgi:hypothetical protein